MWLGLIILATLTTLIAFYRKVPIFFFIAGLLFFMVAFGASEIEFIVTYDNSDYDKAFRYPELILFFGAVAVTNFIGFTYNVWDTFEDELKNLALR